MWNKLYCLSFVLKAICLLAFIMYYKAGLSSYALMLYVYRESLLACIQAYA